MEVTKTMFPLVFCKCGREYLASKKLPATSTWSG